MEKTLRTLGWVVLGLADGVALGAVLGLCCSWFFAGCNSPVEDVQDNVRYGAILGGMLGVIGGAICEARRLRWALAARGSLVILLPALAILFIWPLVNQVNYAARTAIAHGNLRQLGMALQQYQDENGAFPIATLPQEELPPEQRLSWVVAILPFLHEEQLAQAIDPKKGWNAEENRVAVQTTLPVLWEANSMPRETTSVSGRTHYVGISGVGEDSPLLPLGHPRAGVFGYQRRTRLQDIKDGTSHTMMVADTTRDIGLWAAGGPSTVRAVNPGQRPYIGAGRPFGGRVGCPDIQKVCLILLADGSVRSVSSNIKPEVFEGMATIAGNESISDDDF
jgi:hypothetical protein